MKTNLEDDPKYLRWLHELTNAAYDKNITINAGHADAIMSIYALYQGESIDKCLDAYLDFCRRYEALTTGYQQ